MLHESLLVDVVVRASGTFGLSIFGLVFFGDDLFHSTDGTGINLFDFLHFGGDLPVGNFLWRGARRRSGEIGSGWLEVVTVALVVGIFRRVGIRYGQHPVILLPDGGEFGVRTGSGRTQLIGFGNFVVFLLVLIVGGGILLLLQRHGEAVVLLLLRQVRVVDIDTGLGHITAAGAGSTRSGSHHDVIAFRCLAFFAHDFDYIVV